jgi:predicted HicB family RNase H-like nuclease
MSDGSEVYHHMGELRISIPDELHKKLKQRALNREMTLKQLVIDLLADYTENNLEANSKGRKEVKRD